MATASPAVRTGRLTGTRAANRRTWTDRIMRSVAALAAVACVVPLAAVLIFVTINGLGCAQPRPADEADPGAGHRRWRDGRDPRDDPDGRLGDAHRDPVRGPGRCLRQRVQLEPLGACHPVRRGCSGRCPVDPHRRLRVHLPGPAVQAVQRLRRKRRAGGDHDPGHHANDRGDPEARPRARSAKPRWRSGSRPGGRSCPSSSGRGCRGS